MTKTSQDAKWQKRVEEEVNKFNDLLNQDEKQEVDKEEENRMSEEKWERLARAK